MSVTISGDTGVSKVQDGVIVQADLASGVAGNGPAFSAYQSSAQTLGSSTFTKIQFQAEEFDTAACFDSTTNYRFTPNVAGYYQFNASITRGVSNTDMTFSFFKNGVVHKSVSTVYGNAGSISGSALIYCNGTTDYVEIYGYLGAGQSLSAAAHATYFQGFLARAA